MNPVPEKRKDMAKAIWMIISFWMTMYVAIGRRKRKTPANRRLVVTMPGFVASRKKAVTKGVQRISIRLATPSTEKCVIQGVKRNITSLIKPKVI